ncbi:MAG: hypothetical protein GY749_35550, partial [Desulfobacteraceae bacterium]|nr:hypothetical protein [Desulfobacteraceae bacterium]
AMKTYHFGGSVKCSSFEELSNVLKIRYENNSNEYEFYGEEKFPFMTMLVKDELACIHVFQSEDDCGHYAYCKDDVLDEEGFTVFYMGSPTAETEVSNKLVIPFSLAIEIVRDFFKNFEMSKSAEWFEL